MSILKSYPPRKLDGEHPNARAYYLALVRQALSTRMDMAGIGAKPLAKAAGLGETVVRDLLKGHTKDVQLGTLSKIADALDVSLIDILPLAMPGTPIGVYLPIRGAVAAGVWRDAYEYPIEDWETFVGRPDSSYDVEHRFGLRIEGDSMDLVYPHGSVVECVSTKAGISPVSGKRVIVVRKRHDVEVEATVKELVIDKDGVRWLVPRSSNPGFQTPFRLDCPDADITEVEIVAVVVGSYRPE